MIINYSQTNSGGPWWLTDKDWKNLEAAGWNVQWFKEGELMVKEDPNGVYRFLGSCAGGASIEAESPGEAMRAFESITGQDVMEEGCNCCGAPHSFSWGEPGKDYDYASGSMCAEYLFPGKGLKTLREMYEESSK